MKTFIGSKAHLNILFFTIKPQKIEQTILNEPRKLLGSFQPTKIFAWFFPKILD